VYTGGWIRAVYRHDEQYTGPGERKTVQQTAAGDQGTVQESPAGVSERSVYLVQREKEKHYSRAAGSKGEVRDWQGSSRKVKQLGGKRIREARKTGI